MKTSITMEINDKQRWQYCKDHSSWIRSENPDFDYMAVLVPKGSDLSCKAMREAAVDAAIREKEVKNGT